MQETGKQKFVQALESDFYGKPNTINEKAAESDKDGLNDRRPEELDEPNTLHSNMSIQEGDQLMGQALAKILEQLKKKDPLLHKKVLEAVLAD